MRRARQHVGTGSRAPGRRLSVERVPGSRGHMKEGLGGLGGRRNFYSGSREAGVTPSPQCGTTPAFQLKCMLRRERHNLCSRCTYRTIHVDGYRDLQNLQAETHAHFRTHAKAHPPCDHARYNPSSPPCHPARYNPSFMYPPARSNPFRHARGDPGQHARCAIGSTPH